MAGSQPASSRRRLLVTRLFFLREYRPMDTFGDSKPAGPLSQDMLSLGGCFFLGARMS